MNIGVGGAGGQLGQAILNELSERSQGHKIVGISRTPNKTPPGVEGRHGDYDKPETLAQAYAGLDRLVLIPTMDPRPGKRSEQNVAAIDGAVKAGVKHIVFVSAAGTRELFDPHVNACYWVGEQHLMRTASQWTILRMNFFAEAFANQARTALASGVLLGLAENKVAFVSRNDVAAAAAGILIGDGHAGAIYNATGPRAVTGAERAAIVTAVTGQPLHFTPLPEDRLRARLAEAGLPEPVVGVMLMMQSEHAAGGLDIVTGDIEKLSGRPPMPLEEVISSLLK